MSARACDGRGADASCQYGWKRSMAVFIRDDGPLKNIGVARTSRSASENSA